MRCNCVICGRRAMRLNGLLQDWCLECYELLLKVPDHIPVEQHFKYVKMKCNEII